MKSTILTDLVTERSWNLNDLLEKDEEISVGRAEDNLICLGKGVDISSIKTAGNAGQIMSSIAKLATVSRRHATITYQWRGWDGEGFYIQNHSKNPIKICDTVLESGDGKASLNSGEDFEMLFGKYPVRISYKNSSTE